jgi:hypothetical protein
VGYARLPAVAGLSALIALAGCSGGGSGPLRGSSQAGSAAGTVSAGSGTLSVHVALPSSGLLPLFTARARTDAARIRDGVRKRLSITLGSVVFEGTLYPGYAGGTPVKTSYVQNTSSLPSSVTLGFNNVPAGNNEWVVVNVVGFDSPNATGSSYDLGQLAGFASVGAPPALASIDTNSSLRLQVALAAMEAGIISTYDLQNTTALDANIGGFITGTSPNPATGLFTNAQLATFDAGLYPIFSRTLAISGSIATPSYASIVYDYRNPAELDFIANVDSSLEQLAQLDYPNLAQLPYVYGNPFSSASNSSSASTPPSGQQTGQFPGAEAILISAPTGAVTVRNVYGGNLIVGMSAQPGPTTTGPPYYGGFIGVAGRPQSNTTSATVPISNTTVNMAFVDPQWSNMGSSAVRLKPTPTNFGYACAGETCPDAFGAYHVTGTSSTEVTVSMDSWNPFALTGSGWDICTGIDCFPLSNGSQVNSRTPFFDSGTDLPYYNWKPNGGAVTGVTAVPGSYAIAYSGGLSGYIATTTSAWFFPAMVMAVNLSAPDGTVVYVTLYCPTGTFSNSGVLKSGFTSFDLSSVTSTVQCPSTQIGFTLPAGTPTSGTLDISYFGYYYTLSPPGEFIY